MSRRRRFRTVAGACVLALGLIGLGWGLSRVPLTGQRGQLDDWIGRQIVGIVGTYLVPTISFEALDYQAPGRVTLTGVAFTAPDGTRVLELETFGLELAEVPRIGAPIVIERVLIERGRINLIRDAGGDGFKGLVPMTRARPGAEPDEAPEQFRLSRVLRLREVRLSDIAVRYEPGGDLPPMVLEGLSAELLVEPETTSEEAGWYEADLQFGHGSLMALTLPGRINLDTMVVQVSDGSMDVEVGPATIGALPPELQALVTAYEAKGRLAATMSGSVPLTDWPSGHFDARIELDQFGISAGAYRLPIDRLDCTVSLTAGVVEVRDLRAELLGGQVAGQASLSVREAARPMTARWSAEQLDLQALMRTAEGEGASALAGRLSSTGTVRCALSRPRESIDGSGEARIRDGRLVRLPGLTALADRLNLPGNPLRSTIANHRADFVFELEPAGVRITESSVVANTLAARGTGLVGYDGTLDLQVNAGPLERVQAMLGRVGEALGRVTDQVMTYHIGGTVGEPKVGVSVLNGGR